MNEAERKNKMGKPWCCVPQCEQEAQYEIRRDEGLPYDPYDYTHSCSEHIADLLYPEVSLVYTIEMALTR